ncbi:hypothetical protein CVT25_005275, partial [Psilocybe cyanescens]
MPHFLRHIASSFTQNPETNQLETPIFDTPLTDQTVEDLEMLRREILTQYNKAIDQKETAKQNYRPAAARLAHHQARSQCLKLNLVEWELYQRFPLIAKPSEQRNMSFIDTPAASSSSTPDHSCMQGKRPAVPSHARTLSTFEALDLFADEETAQKICLYFEDPDTVLALNELAKVSRAHQQEERDIRLARHRSRVRQTMATVLLDKLQSWGLEREIEDVLWKHCRESPTVRKPSVFPLTSFHLQNTVPSQPLPARPPAYHFASRLNDLQKQQLVNEARPLLHLLQRIAQRAQHWSRAFNAANLDIFAQDAPNSNASTATNTHPDIPSETAAITQKTSNTLTPIMEELTRIFSTTPESPTPQANHTETIEPTEVMDFT